MNTQPVVLEGRFVRLEPLSERHFETLWSIAQDEQLWRYMSFPVRSYDELCTALSGQLEQQRHGQAMPFATRRLGSAHDLVGATSFLEIHAAHRRLEIGSTWITATQQRTPVNTEAKLLQLTHAFEVMGCNRVELKTDALNQRSRSAIKRIGATEEGTFRNHMVMPDGRLRHSVYYSITREEWPDRKAALRERLNA